MAAILIFAFAGTALAAVNRSGQDYFGAAPAANASATLGQDTNVYMNWTTAKLLGSNVADGNNSPHSSYTTTTVKCVVCHSVHYAAPGNAPVSSNAQTADTLLRMRADQACVYCHATAGMSVNGRPVYDGATPNPNNAVVGHITGPNCNVCHTSVHGDPADNSVAALSGFLLRTMPGNDNLGAWGAINGPTANMITAIEAIDYNAVGQGWTTGEALGNQPWEFASINTPQLREKAIGIFCAECHAGSYSQVAAGASTNVQDWTLPNSPYSGHRIEASATTAWNSANDVSSSNNWSDSTSSTIGAVAWLPATNCKSCHGADDIYGNTGFPHSWGSSKMWLLTGADSSQSLKIFPFADPASFGAGGDPLQLQLQDGVCLRCHRSSTGEGVEYTF
jgi:hypothetical protein